MATSHRSVEQVRRYLPVAQEWLLKITRGEFEPGHRLPSDREIAEQSNVKRATAREAMLALELLGVIEIRHGEGTFVSSATVSLAQNLVDVLHFPPFELIEARASIEPVVASLAATTISRDRLAVLRKILADATAVMRNEERLPEFVRLGLLFHTELAPACGNRIIASISRDLVDVEQHPLWSLVNQQAMMSATAREAQITEHTELLDAIERGDTQASSTLMTHHVEALMRQIFGSQVDRVMRGELHA